MSRRIESLVADIADDVSVDWRAVAGGSQSGDLVREFRIIAAVGAGREKEAERSPGSQIVTALLTAAVAVAAIRLIIGFAAIATASPLRIGPRAVLAVIFSLGGAALLAGGRRDPRALALGGLFVLIGSPFIQPYLVRAQSGMLALPASWLVGTSPEAFLAVALWVFAWMFPSIPRTPRQRRTGRWGIGMAACLGVLLVIGNALSDSGVSGGSVFAAAALQTFERGAPQLLSWPLLVMASLPAFPYLLWKSSGGTVEDRSRFSFLALGIVGGLAPMGLAVVASSVVPAMARPDLQGVIGLGLYFAMACILPLTAYAVVARRVLNVQLVIRRAVQHALARQVVWAVIIWSVGYVAVNLYLGRARPLGEFLSDQVGLMSLAAFGFAVLTFRGQVLKGVDRWFQLGAADSSEVMARLANDMGGQRNLSDMVATLMQELKRTFQHAQITIVVLNDVRSAFVSLEGKAPALPVSSAIVGLFQSTRRDLCLSGEAADPIAHLLPRQDKAWLATLGVEWVFPIVDLSSAILGFVCLGEGHGPSYSRRDRVLVSAMAGHLGLMIASLSRHRWPVDRGADGLGGTAAPVDWANERAMQCPTCKHVVATETFTCTCGARLQPASVPLVLNGKFQMERVIGSGGMGVVYAAVDTTLNRRVAVKTMPTVTPRHVARLQREAKAMASVGHPNLAMIFSVERWRDVPLLVVEYLEGGTLADGLNAGPMSVEDTLDLGIVLADALDCMHAGGLLHRDIKPSNIGYTADGVPKLLDFGLAAMLHHVGDEDTLPVAPSRDAGSHTATLDAVTSAATRTLTQLVGTPLYLSPEALAGEVPDASFDLWSLSVVLYEAICARHPLAGYPAVEAMRRTRSVRLPDVRDSRKDCPSALAALLNDALSLSKDRRPQTAADLRVQLQSIRRAFATPHRPSRPPLY